MPGRPCGCPEGHRLQQLHGPLFVRPFSDAKDTEQKLSEGLVSRGRGGPGEGESRFKTKAPMRPALRQLIRSPAAPRVGAWVLPLCLAAASAASVSNE